MGCCWPGRQGAPEEQGGAAPVLLAARDGEGTGARSSCAPRPAGSSQPPRPLSCCPDALLPKPGPSSRQSGWSTRAGSRRRCPHPSRTPLAAWSLRRALVGEVSPIRVPRTPTTNRSLSLYPLARCSRGLEICKCLLSRPVRLRAGGGGGGRAGALETCGDPARETQTASLPLLFELRKPC